ncbi:MAG: chemotaxis protein CheW [Desulfobulbaceae bacterium]|nr:chemotaxis protein CheW [Desulfobulbaceae bacterium]
MTAADNQQATTYSKSSREGKYLTFTLANETYGVPVLKVKEILGMMPINTIPQTPEAVMGVVNLRDKVIPILDLRTRFGMEPAAATSTTCIIVTEGQRADLQPCWEAKQCGKPECPAHGSNDHRCWMISGTFCRNEIQGTYHEKIEACRKCTFYQAMHEQKAMFVMGMIVDAVQEVSVFKEEDIEEPPVMSGNVRMDYIRGIAKKDGAVKILLDIDKVLIGAMP